MNNEEKILAMLEALDKKIDAQGKGLGEQLAQVKGQLQELDDRFVRAALIQENEILPKIQVLFERTGAIMEQLDRRPTEDRVEDLESDMRIVKGAVSRLRQDVDELKKAQ